jgi:integrase
MEFVGATACDTLQRMERQNRYVSGHTSTLTHLHSVALRCSQSRRNVTTVRPPKTVARLTSTRVESLKPTNKRYEIGDTEVRGLQVRVAPTGVKSWHWRFYWQGKQVRLVLGTWPKVSLATAHEQAASARELLRKGIDPRRSGLTRAMRVKAEKPPSAGVAGHSVAHLAAEFMARHVKRQRRRPEYVQRILDANILPRWANRDARTIKPREVIELLDEIADRAPVMANRVAGLLSQMFRFGIHRSILDTTPVQLLYRPGGKEKPRARVFSEEELKAFVTNLDDACRFQRLPHVLRVLLLTLQRRSELALAEWREFNFIEKTWTIPDAHAKAGKGHVLPLSDWALEELQKLKVMANGSRYVLPNADNSAPIDPKYITRSVARCLKRFKKHGVAAFTPHDLRRTGRTGLAKVGVKVDIAERVLNHARDRIEATYDVHEYLDEKREALEKWTQYVADLRDGQPATARRPDVGRTAHRT